MAREWTPNEVNRLIAVATGCICVMTVVMGALLLIMLGRITPDMLGTIKGGGLGGGILGLAGVGVMVLRSGLPSAGKKKP